MLQAGFDPYKYHPEKYDRAILAYLLSYWLNSIFVANEDTSPREWRLRVAQARGVDECFRLLKVNP